MSEQTSPPQSPSASPGPGPAVEIVELAHHLELGPLLAGWHAAEWAHLYEPHVWNRTIAEAEFAAMTMPGTIPTTWVAFEGAGRTEEHVLGSVSLIASVGDGVIYLNAVKDKLNEMMRESARR